MTADQPLYPGCPVLVVDDEDSLLSLYSAMLHAEGISNIVTCRRAEEALKALESQEVSFLLTDLAMPGMSGEELLDVTASHYPGIPKIVITASDELDIAVRCMKKGALDFLVKPVDKARFSAAVRQAMEISDLRKENQLLNRKFTERELSQNEAFAHIITQDAGLRTIFRYVESIARTLQPVLITGETGVGKELIARAIHLASGRKGEFVAVDVAGLDSSAFSDTLFGHRKGAFTGADTPRTGLVLKAANGTLFLDEIGDLHEESQVKLLRLLQERLFFPLGSDTAASMNARVVVATNRDVRTLCAAGRLRRDLFFRLQTHHIRVPPLRNRVGDIPMLVRFFLGQAAMELNKPPPVVAPDALRRLMAYSFPGNVRELRSMIFDAVSRAQAGQLEAADFDLMADSDCRAVEQPAAGGQGAGLNSVLRELTAGERVPTLADAENRLIARALEITRNNVSMAAGMLGVSRQTLYRKLKADR